MRWFIWHSFFSDNGGGASDIIGWIIVGAIIIATIKIIVFMAWKLLLFIAACGLIGTIGYGIFSAIKKPKETDVAVEEVNKE